MSETMEPSNALTRASGQIAVTAPMNVDQLLDHVRLVQQVMQKVMHHGEHYGAIPGTGDKKTLLLPGAQKLCMVFRLAPSYEIQETNHDKGHKEYRVVCTLNSNSGSFVGQGVGVCSTLESKYRWRNANRKCPQCSAESIIAQQAQYMKNGEPPGWVCWKKKNGCGATFPVDDPRIMSQPMGKIDNPDPADLYNTVLKMAKKRAFVDATITVTSASDIFTQDVGDEEIEQEPPVQQVPIQQPAPAQPAPATPARPNSVPVPMPPAAAEPPPAIPKEILDSWKRYLDVAAKAGRAEVSKAWTHLGAQKGGVALQNKLKLDGFLDELRAAADKVDLARNPPKIKEPEYQAPPAPPNDDGEEWAEVECPPVPSAWEKEMKPGPDTYNNPDRY